MSRISQLKKLIKDSVQLGFNPLVIMGYQHELDHLQYERLDNKMAQKRLSKMF